MTESANLNLPAGWSARPACNGDADAIRALVFGALREYGLAPDPTGTDADLDDIERHYWRDDGWFVVIEDANGELADSVALSRHTADTAELRKMYLPRNARRRGLASGCLNAHWPRRASAVIGVCSSGRPLFFTKLSRSTGIMDSSRSR